MLLRGPNGRARPFLKFLNIAGTITQLPLKSAIAENGYFQLYLDFKGQNVNMPALFKNFRNGHALELYKDSF
jgi:hypothetical protein